MHKETNSIFTLLKGAAMGIAEIIPGVSGGTIAFITGIYERLLNAIKSIDLVFFKSFFSGKFKQAITRIDGGFLITLAIGMAIGVVIGVFGIGYLLENHPAPLWSFFFGLIIASSIYIARQVTDWEITQAGLLIFGFVVAWGITYISPVEGSTNLLWVFICGFIAISALILPGISGSFLLLILGMYTVIRSNLEMLISEQSLASFIIISIFALGCIAGLLSFSRVLSYMFANYKNSTLALLTGFMLGSLRKIWPWRNPEMYMNKKTGLEEHASNISFVDENYKLLSELNVMPSDYVGNSELIWVIIAGIAGFAIIFLLDAIATKGEK